MVKLCNTSIFLPKPKLTFEFCRFPSNILEIRIAYLSYYRWSRSAKFGIRKECHVGRKEQCGGLRGWNRARQGWFMIVGVVDIKAIHLRLIPLPTATSPTASNPVDTRIPWAVQLQTYVQRKLGYTRQD